MRLLTPVRSPSLSMHLSLLALSRATIVVGRSRVSMPELWCTLYAARSMCSLIFQVMRHSLHVL